jgi:hypothetical protein
MVAGKIAVVLAMATSAGSAEQRAFAQVWITEIDPIRRRPRWRATAS